METSLKYPKFRERKSSFPLSLKQWYLFHELNPRSFFRFEVKFQIGTQHSKCYLLGCFFTILFGNLYWDKFFIDLRNKVAIFVGNSGAYGIDITFLLITGCAYSLVWSFVLSFINCLINSFTVCLLKDCLRFDLTLLSVLGGADLLIGSFIFGLASLLISGGIGCLALLVVLCLTYIFICCIMLGLALVLILSCTLLFINGVALLFVDWNTFFLIFCFALLFISGLTLVSVLSCALLFILGIAFLTSNKASYPETLYYFTTNWLIIFLKFKPGLSCAPKFTTEINFLLSRLLSTCLWHFFSFIFKSTELIWI